MRWKAKMKINMPPLKVFQLTLVIDKTASVASMSGPGCSKLTMLLVNVSLNFQTLISRICQYYLLKMCEKLLQCKSFSHFFNKKFQCI